MDAADAMSMLPGNISDRSALHFVDEVKSRFSFLQFLGFRCVRTEPTFVRFESSKIGINIYHGRRSFEIGFEMESMPSSINAYSFPEILRLIDQELGDKYKYYATHTVQGVAEGVTKLAELFNRCISAGILNDENLFYRLQSQREEITSKYAEGIQLKHARNAAEIAWRKKDYVGVVKVLKPLQSMLTPSEIRKLEFSEKNVAQRTRKPGTDPN